MMIEEGVLGRRGRIIASEICAILLIIQAAIIVLHYHFLVSWLILVLLQT